MAASIPGLQIHEAATTCLDLFRNSTSVISRSGLAAIQVRVRGANILNHIGAASMCSIPCRTGVMYGPVTHACDHTRMAQDRQCRCRPQSASLARNMSEAVPKPLASRVWSCSELAKGAQVVADISGMELRNDPANMSRDDLLRAIGDSQEYEWVL